MTSHKEATRQWLIKRERDFPKTVRVSLDLKNEDVKKYLGHGVRFIRAPFAAEDYCIFGFKDEFTLTTFCKHFSKYLVSGDNHGDI